MGGLNCFPGLKAFFLLQKQDKLAQIPGIGGRRVLGEPPGLGQMLRESQHIFFHASPKDCLEAQAFPCA
jgi:hypothetical protein